MARVSTSRLLLLATLLLSRAAEREQAVRRHFLTPKGVAIGAAALALALSLQGCDPAAEPTVCHEGYRKWYPKEDDPDWIPSGYTHGKQEDPTCLIKKQDLRDLHKRVERMYETYNDEKAGDVPALLEKYAGREHQLLRELVEKYGPECRAPDCCPVSYYRPTCKSSWDETELEDYKRYCEHVGAGKVQFEWNGFDCSGKRIKGRKRFQVDASTSWGIPGNRTNFRCECYYNKHRDLRLAKATKPVRELPR